MLSTVFTRRRFVAWFAILALSGSAQAGGSECLKFTISGGAGSSGYIYVGPNGFGLPKIHLDASSANPGDSILGLAKARFDAAAAGNRSGPVVPFPGGASWIVECVRDSSTGGGGIVNVDIPGLKVDIDRVACTPFPPCGGFADPVDFAWPFAIGFGAGGVLEFIVKIEKPDGTLVNVAHPIPTLGQAVSQIFESAKNALGSNGIVAEIVEKYFDGRGFVPSLKIDSVPAGDRVVGISIESTDPGLSFVGVGMPLTSTGVPSMSQWGIFILTMLLLGVGASQLLVRSR